MGEPMKPGIHAVPNPSPPTTEKIDTTGKDIVFLSVQQVTEERSERMNPIDYPWAVVTIMDGVPMSSWHYHNPIAAQSAAEGWIALGYDEAHVVPLGDLLAWVRANAREGRT